ncbi:MAG: hypothetical protein QM760_12510 [Nibricoccus sp.]
MKSKSTLLMVAGCILAVMMVIVGPVEWMQWKEKESVPPGLGHGAVKGEMSARTQNFTRDGGALPSQDARISKTVAPVSAELMAALRLKLKQWRETETGAEAAQGRLIEEWLALLDAATVGDVVLALTEDELATPLGVAAYARWLNAEPEDALEWIKTRGRGSEGETLLVVQALLVTPAKLSAFCEDLPDSEWKQAFLTMAGLQAVGMDPAVTLDIAKHMKAGDARTNVLQTLAYDWMTRDPGAATTWLLTVPEPEMKETLFAAGAKAIAVTDPDLAVRWMSAGIKTEATFADTALCVVEIWAERDPAKAGSWVAQFPPGRVRNDAIDLMSRRWLQADPSAAKDWIRQLPEGTSVFARLKAEELARGDPPAE